MSSPVIAGPTNAKPGDSKVTTKTELLVTMNPEAEASMTAEEMEYLPNVAGAYMNRSQIYSKKGDLDAALADLNKSLAIYPNFSAYGVRGRLWQQRGDLSAALADFSKSIELQPGDAYRYLERAEVLMLMGKDGEAEKDFKRSLEIDPGMATMVANRRAAVKKQMATKP
jgi:tetratricopeptide (TPR) repeat protein